MKCLCCGGEAVNQSLIVDGLSFCHECRHFSYSLPANGDLRNYTPADVLRAIREISFQDSMYNISSISIVGDICVIDSRVLQLMSKIAESEYPLQKKIEEITEESSVFPIIDDIVNLYLVDSLSTEYIVRCYAYAAAKEVQYIEIDKILQERAKNGVVGMFVADSSAYMVGQVATLRWKVYLKWPTVKIEVDGKDVYYGNASEGCTDIIVTNDCLAKLTAIDRKTMAEIAIQYYEIKVARPIKILCFTADKQKVIETEKVMLKWDAENASSISISPDVGDVTGLRSVIVCPNKPTVYRLTARNELSVAEETVTICVQPLPIFDVEGAVSLANLKIPSVMDIDIPSIQPEYQKPIWKDMLLKPFVLTEKLFAIIDSYPNKIKELIKK